MFVEIKKEEKHNLFATCTYFILIPNAFSTGEIKLAEKKYHEAELIYYDLLHRNPENYLYYQKLEECLNLRKLCACLLLLIILYSVHICLENERNIYILDFKIFANGLAMYMYLHV